MSYIAFWNENIRHWAFPRVPHMTCNAIFAEDTARRDRRRNSWYPKAYGAPTINLTDFSFGKINWSVRQSIQGLINLLFLPPLHEPQRIHDWGKHRHWAGNFSIGVSAVLYSSSHHQGRRRPQSSEHESALQHQINRMIDNPSCIYKIFGKLNHENEIEVPFLGPNKIPSLNPLPFVKAREEVKSPILIWQFASYSRVSYFSQFFECHNSFHSM